MLDTLPQGLFLSAAEQGKVPYLTKIARDQIGESII
jgi:hypothetical protein